MESSDRYQIIEEIGRGAMGIVYRGRDPKIDREVALKCLRPNILEAHAAAGRRFQQEILALGRLTHPNIVTIFDVWEDPSSGSTYIVMEYVEGTSLAQPTQGKTPLTLEQIVRIGVQICTGLDFAHSKGVIHRDIKPGNILLSNDFNVAKITDFGIARLDDIGMTQTHHLTGTPLYMSPEQCRGETLDGRSDLFAVGVLLYELLTRKKTFQGDSLTGIMHQVLNHTPYPPHLISDEVPEKLSAVVMKALEKDPRRRFESGLKMADALAKSIEQTKTFPGTETFEKTEILSSKTESRSFLTRQISFWSEPLFLVPVVLLLSIVGIFYFSSRSPVKVGIPMGHVIFATTPTGANVLINGEMKGVSPISIDLPAGSHELVISKTGYDDLEATIDVPSGEKVPINLKLLAEEKP